MKRPFAEIEDKLEQIRITPKDVERLIEKMIYITIRFAQLAMPQHKAVLDRAELLRRRRHQVTYGTAYIVSEEEIGPSPWALWFRWEPAIAVECRRVPTSPPTVAVGAM